MRRRGEEKEREEIRGEMRIWNYRREERERKIHSKR